MGKAKERKKAEKQAAKLAAKLAAAQAAAEAKAERKAERKAAKAAKAERKAAKQAAKERRPEAKTNKRLDKAAKAMKRAKAAKQAAASAPACPPFPSEPQPPSDWPRDVPWPGESDEQRSHRARGATLVVDRGWREDTTPVQDWPVVPVLPTILRLERVTRRLRWENSLEGENLEGPTEAFPYRTYLDQCQQCGERYADDPDSCACPAAPPVATGEALATA